MRILVIHGPNLQLLGKRQPSVYGTTDLSTINNELKRLAVKYSAALTIAQSNHEGEIVSLIAKARDLYDGIVLNPAAYTHTSVAIRDAIEAVGLPVVEVHLSNVYARETFRHQSLVAPVCRGQITGFGALSYLLGFEALVEVVQVTHAAQRASAQSLRPAIKKPTKPRRRKT